MDDVNHGEHVDTVVRDVEMFRIKGREMGLQLNVQKCELFIVNSSHSLATYLKDFAQMEPTNYCLVGAKFFSAMSWTTP